MPTFLQTETKTARVTLRNPHTVAISGTVRFVLGSVPILPCGDMGDVDGDGFVTVIDALFVSQYAAGNRDLTQEQLQRADVNGDGVVDVQDAKLIVEYLIGAIRTFPACSMVWETSITIPAGGTVGLDFPIRMSDRGVGSWPVYVEAYDLAGNVIISAQGEAVVIIAGVTGTIDRGLIYYAGLINWETLVEGRVIPQGKDIHLAPVWVNTSGVSFDCYLRPG